MKAPEFVLHFSRTSFARPLVFEFQPNGRLPFLVAFTVLRESFLGRDASETSVLLVWTTCRNRFQSW
jgi:hypothetical protein